MGNFQRMAVVAKGAAKGILCEGNPKLVKIKLKLSKNR